MGDSEENLTCPYCNYTPGKYPRGITEFLEQDGYEDSFLFVSFGPKQSGTTVICPLCGRTVAIADSPEPFFTIEEHEEIEMEWEEDTIEVSADIPGVELDDIELPELGSEEILSSIRALPLPHLTPDKGEPGVCKTCGSVIQPSESHIIEVGENSVIEFCDASCQTQWEESSE